MLGRMSIAFVGAIVVTFSLFSLMQSLISRGDAGFTNAIKGRVIEFVRLKRSSDLELKKRELPQKEKPKVQPQQPDFELPTSSGDSLAQAVNIAIPQVQQDFRFRGKLSLGGAMSDRDPVPFVRLDPAYPPRAAERGVEGWVEVGFTISATGSVKDPVIVAAEPPGVFDRSALRAIRKWKYKPQIEGGVAIERPNIRVRLTFELEGKP